MTNLATERARRLIDPVLDTVDQIRAELEADLRDTTALRLHDLALRLSNVGLTMLAATTVMAEDFDGRLRALDTWK